MTRPYETERPVYTRTGGVCLTAGVTLKAVESLANRDQQHFTREQVAYLIALAYDSGVTQGRGDLAEHLEHAADMAEVADCWRQHAQPRPTREQRVAQRLADMEAGVQREANRPGRPRPSPSTGWPEVTRPGSAERPRLRVAA